MKDIVVKIGDLFLIPFDCKYAVCKVLWIGKRTKNVFSFIVKYKLAISKEDAMEISKNNGDIKIKIFTGLIEVFYTDITKIKKGEWVVIGNIPLNDEESNNLQYHNIGGKLFRGDEEIRALNTEEIRIIPKMLNAGYEAISNFLKIAFSS